MDRDPFKNKGELKAKNTFPSRASCGARAVHYSNIPPARPMPFEDILSLLAYLKRKTRSKDVIAAFQTPPAHAFARHSV